MERADNIAPTPIEPDHTRILLEQLSVIICRLQAQLDEVSQQLELSLTQQTEARSQPHIIALRSLKTSLQSELKSNQTTLEALKSSQYRPDPDHSSGY